MAEVKLNFEPKSHKDLPKVIATIDGEEYVPFTQEESVKYFTPKDMHFVCVWLIGLGETIRFKRK